MVLTFAYYRENIATLTVESAQSATPTTSGPVIVTLTDPGTTIFDTFPTETSITVVPVPSCPVFVIIDSFPDGATTSTVGVFPTQDPNAPTPCTSTVTVIVDHFPTPTLLPVSSIPVPPGGTTIFDPFPTDDVTSVEVPPASPTITFDPFPTD